MSPIGSSSSGRRAPRRSWSATRRIRIGRSRASRSASLMSLAGISFLADIEPDWQIVAAISGEADAGRRREAWGAERDARARERRRLGVEQ